MLQRSRSSRVVFLGVLAVGLLVSYLFYRSKPNFSILVNDSPKATLSKKRYSLVEIVEAKKTGALNPTVNETSASKSLPVLKSSRQGWMPTIHVV